MKLPYTFNSLFFLANARARLAWWLRESRRAARRWSALGKPMPADIAAGFSGSVTYWRNEIQVCQGWLTDAAEGFTSRHGFGPFTPHS
jgi:hypothetical protein